MRNPDSRWCESHHAISHLATKVVLASGTIAVNKPLDLAGLCKAGNCPSSGGIDFQSPKVWCKGRDTRTVDRATVDKFHEAFVNRATEAILGLCPLEQEVVDYPVSVAPDSVGEYNLVLADAKNLKLRIERAERVTGKDLQRLMSLLGLMQQMVVHPLLAEMGAARFKTERELFDQAAAAPTGAMWALKGEIEALRAQGHHRVVVSCCHTSILEIARRFLVNYPELGTVDTFSGELSTTQRQKVKERFLKSQNAVLMLSIGAGGVGLHLVPGCEAMIFWGSMPFSPAHTRQCMKRIHRLGQHAPVTGKVSIKHLVPYGSVDAAIGRVHSDKERLIALVQDGDDTGFDRVDDATWRKYGRRCQGRSNS
jgi:SNF2 family DNA or RNA helicase